MRPFHLTVEEIIAIAQPVRAEGKTKTAISGLASLDAARPGDLSFLDNTIYEKQVADTRASVVLLPEKFEANPKDNQLFLFVKKPSFALSLIGRGIEQQLFPKPAPGIHPSAIVDREAEVHPEAHVGPLCVVGASAQIHKGAILRSGCVIGAHAVIGADTELKPRVTVMDDCAVGERCVLHSGVVVGSDGFGFATIEGKHLKIPQIGCVVIEDDAEIGANTTIDRARFGATRIGTGTKIDNLVQIGHNVTIGKCCLIVAQCGIAGSTVLEDYVVLGGQVGIAGHLRVGARTQVAGKSGVNHSQGPDMILSGWPAMELQKAYRIEILKRKLPELFKRVGELEERMKNA
jgi:UDP-3-O-[3-hydroxymyristoyl] glucosamine N-acyltransferase